MFSLKSGVSYLFSIFRRANRTGACVTQLLPLHFVHGNIRPSCLTVYILHRMFKKRAEAGEWRTDCCTGFTPFEPLTVHFLEMFRLLSEMSLLLHPHLTSSYSDSELLQYDSLVTSVQSCCLLSLISVQCFTSTMCSFLSHWGQVVIIWCMSLFVLFFFQMSLRSFWRSCPSIAFWTHRLSWSSGVRTRLCRGAMLSWTPVLNSSLTKPTKLYGNSSPSASAVPNSQRSACPEKGKEAFLFLLVYLLIGMHYI